MKIFQSDESDLALIGMTLLGDCEAFGRLVVRYQQRLFNGMVQLVRNEAEAEDVVQDAFLLALKRLETFQGKSEFYTWLYRIAYNVAISRIRRRKPTVPLDRLASEKPLRLPDKSASPDEPLLQRERADQVLRALGQLSPEHQHILILREIESMDYSAIAQILDIPLGTVRSRIHRARLLLKEILETILESH